MSQSCTFSEAINMALADALEADTSVVLLGEDVADREGGGVVKVTAGLSNRFGDQRVRSTPISEEAIIGSAIGASLIGYKPVAEIMLMNFFTVAMDQLTNHAAKLRYMSGGQTNVPITLRTMTGAGMGAGGQHSDMLEAWLAHTAGLKVVCASTPAEAYGLLRACIDDPDPCVFIENMPTYWTKGPAPVRGSRLPLGKANVDQEGRDITLIGYGRMMMELRGVAAELRKSGVSVELIDLRTISPLDTATVLTSVRKTGRAVVVHEAVKPFGVGAELSARIAEEAFASLKSPVERLGASFNPVPYAQALEAAHMPSVPQILAACHRALALEEKV